MRTRIRSYAEAAQFLGDRSEKSTGQRGTVVLRLTPTAIAVRYHNTDVVTYYHPEVPDMLAKIDNGGWLTHTTVARINEYAPEGIEEVRLIYGGETGEPSMVVVGDPDGCNIALPFVVSRQHSTKASITKILRSLANIQD